MLLPQCRQQPASRWITCRTEVPVPVDGLAVSEFEDRRAAIVGAVVLAGARLAEVLAHHDVGGELAPLLGDLGVVHLEDDGAVGIRDAASLFPVNVSKTFLTGPCESA